MSTNSPAISASSCPAISASDTAIKVIPDNSMQTEYFRLTEIFIKRFGANTILFMQVGAFYEMYATRNPDTGILSRSRIEDVATICGGLSVTDKKQTHGKDMVVMAGFRDYNVERYIQSVVDADFTAVVYTQKELENGKMTRELSGIYSPGTFLPADSPRMTNNVLCLWLDIYTPKIGARKSKQILICGASVVNIFTGKSTLFEYETSMEMVPATFDALERFVCTHAPSETIFVTPFEKDADSKRVLQYVGVESRTIHLLRQCQIDPETQESKEIVDRCRQQKYIRHILSTFFKDDTFDVCDEFRNYVVATQAFCYLLNFIQERNANLVRKIALPQFDNQTTNMVLANHTLRQLNIIDDGNFSASDADMSTVNLRSVYAFLNKCGSAVGRRRFMHQILHPTFDEKWLNSEYDAVAKLLESSSANNAGHEVVGVREFAGEISLAQQRESRKSNIIDQIRKILREVADLEKIGRQLVSRKLNPDSAARLYKSVLAIQQIHSVLIESCPELCGYFCGESIGFTDFEEGSKSEIFRRCDAGASNENEDPNREVESWITHILEFISVNLIVERCTGCSSMTSFDDNILRPGVSEELDALIRRMQENEDLFQEIRRTFNGIMAKIDSVRNSNTDYVKVHDTEKMGSTLQLTKKRSATLKKHLGEMVKKDPAAKIVFSLGASKSNVSVLVSEIQTTASGLSNDTIRFNLLDRIINEKITIRDTINSTISKAYFAFLERLETHCLETIERVTNFIAKVDVLQSKAYAAKTYGYCRPTIVGPIDANNRSFFDAKGLRHVLIEHIQTQELYVANDLTLSTSASPCGMLLYGTNAVGKTSFIRALGIAIIMAQSGMYVPCSALTYRPYRAIFTRILGNDNLFKNLSMFAVEMSELRVILNSADEYSLVLGDELCSGTETESALSIFVSGLTELHQKRATFLFATHFHEILKFEEVKALTSIATKHMAVHYDRELDCLVYDRVLREGAGNRLYGLEVAKSLHLPDEFIERAYQIRNKYYPDVRGSLSSPSTKYNASKIRGVCEICKVEVAEETHHLLQQKLADENGLIDGAVHKNHSANLMSLCENCHLLVHQEETKDVPSPPKPKIVRKKTTKGLMVIGNSISVQKPGTG